MTTPTSPLLVIWSLRSRRDLNAIHAYVAQYAPKAAERLATNLFETAESLATEPRRGRLIHGEVRELVIARPYLIRYRISGHTVQILYIKHGARL